MTYPEAALKILEEAGRPLDYQQITAIALERNWIEPQGPDPAGIMNTLIMQDLKTKGVRSEFSRLGPGTYALRKLVYKAVPDVDEPPPPAAAPHARRGRPRREGNVALDRPRREGNVAVDRPRREGNVAVDRPRREGNVAVERPRREGSGRMDRPPAERPKPDRPPMERRPHRMQPPPPRPPRPVKFEDSVHPEGEVPVSAKELWALMETFGTIMGYKIQPVLLADGKTHCMGWHIGGNPELVFILWVAEGTDMKAGINELIGLNYHKAVVMATDEAMAAAEAFLMEQGLVERADLISINLLGAQASAGIRYMNFYNRLCDCRPAQERRGFLIG